MLAAATALTFDADTHTYFFDGAKVWRSVTGVLQAAGAIDFGAIPPFVLDRARRRGQIVHQAIHFLNDDDLNVAAFRADFPDYVPYVDAWQTFCRQRRFQAVLNEHRVYSRQYDLAGTIDCLGVLDGHAALLDFATGRPEDVAKEWQTAAYLAIARAWQADDPALAAFFADFPVVRRYAIQLRRDGTFRVEPYQDPRDTRHFFTLVEAQRLVALRRREPDGIADV